MTNEAFQKLFDKLKDEVIQLAMTTFNQYKNEAKTDALSLLGEIEANLKTWTLQLAGGQLSTKDFEFLVLAQKELVEMNALKQAGLALIKADEFKNSLLNLITKTVVGLV